MKKYKATLLTDEEMLVQTYIEGHGLESSDDIDIEEVIKNELGWVLSSGIDVIGDLEEVQEDKTTISIEWSVEDIQGIVFNDYEKSISDQDAVVVLEYLEDNYDPSIGITWQTINDAIDELSRDNIITLYN